jgi:uncharacterized HAD superfamily protein
VAGAENAIAELAKDYALHIVTSRPESVRALTLSWLDKYFPDFFADYHFTNIYAGDEGTQPKNKSAVCQEIGAELLIDDALRHVRDVTDAGITALLPDRPWNRGPEPAGVRRVYSWPDAVTWIKQNI